MFIDIIVLIVLLVSSIIAFLRGFIREILTITGILGGLVAAYFAGPLVIPLMRGWLGVPSDTATNAAESGTEAASKLFGIIPYEYVADALAYGSVFIIFVLILSFISHFLAELAGKMGLGMLDRTLGVVFGIIRGLVLVGLLYMPFYVGGTQEQKKEWLAGSKTGPYLETVSGWLYQFFPQVLKADAAKISDDASKVNAARELLEKQGLLENSEGDNKGENSGKSSGKSGDNDKGYTDEFRNQMDKLIRDKSSGSDSKSAPHYNE